MFHPVPRDDPDAPNADPSAASPAGYGRLRGAVALIAGGGGGMGQAIARLFVREGAGVVVADLSTSDAKKVAESLGAAGEYAELDVREPAQWQRAVEACHTHFGTPPDILVVSSGLMVCAPIDTCSTDEMQLAYEVNTVGPVLGIQAVAPAMRQRGKGAIVVITSLGGVGFGVPGMAPYVMSKAALGAAVKCAALDFAGSGIRVNNIVPGQIDTQMSRNAGVSAGVELFSHMPIPRVGLPRDIAGAAVFLASDESSWMTGAELVVDGGMNAGPSL
jgi:3alpha(or 20beta)-hydroxysteroid dehydrogenase